MRPTRTRRRGPPGPRGPHLLPLAGLLLLLLVILGWAITQLAPVSLQPDGRHAEIPFPGSVPPGGVRPAEIVVDPKGGGDATTIADALAIAPAGATIRIRHGIYGVGIELNRDVHLLGDPERPQMVSIIVSDEPCLTSRTANSSVRGIALRNEGEGRTPCVAVTSGQLELDDVTIGSGSGSALAVAGDAEAIGHRLAIRDSGQAGVSVRDGGRLLLEDSSIEASRGSGISLVSSGEVTLRNDRIVGNAGTGIVVADDAKAQLIENEVSNNAWSGVEVLRASTVVVVGNVITDNREAGIYLSREAGGRFSGNRLSGNGLSGIVVDNSTGDFDDNEVRDNSEHGIYVSRGGIANFVGNRVTENHGHGMAIDDGSRARVKDNHVDGNGRVPQVAGPTERIR